MYWDDYHFIVLHGFNNPQAGANNIDLLLPLLQGATVNQLDRDYDGLVEARYELALQAQRLRYAIELAPQHRKVLILAHSHGCNITRAALSKGAQAKLVDAVILFNPAVRRNASFNGVPTLCFHSPSDRVVTSSLLLRLLPWNWIWKHPWGEAGRFGLIPRNGEVRINCNSEELTGEKIGHSDIFYTGQRRTLIINRMKKFLRSLSRSR